MGDIRKKPTLTAPDSMSLLTLAGLFVLCSLGASALADDPGTVPENQPPLPVRCLSFSPDGRSLAAGYGANSGAGALVVWDLPTGNVRYAQPQETIVPSVAFSQDGKLLAMATFSNTARVLDSATGEINRELAGHEDKMRSVAFSPDGKTLATGSYDRTIKLWDVATGELLRALSGHTKPVRVISFSPDGKWLASAGGEENSARLWDINDASAPPRKFDNSNYVPQAAFSPDSKTLAMATWGGKVLLFDCESGATTQEFGNMPGVDWVAFSPDGDLLVVATMNLELRVIKWHEALDEAGKHEIAALIARFEDDDYGVREAASRRLEERAAAALPQLQEGEDSSVPEIRVRCRRIIQRMQQGDLDLKLHGHRQDPECLAFSADSKLLASGDWQGDIILWDVATWKPVQTLRASGKPQ